MKEKESGIMKRYFLPFLCLLISILGIKAQAAAEKQAPSQTFLEVTVLDKVTGESLPGVKVSVRVIQEAGGDIRKTETTDEKGQCSFPIDDKNIELLRLEAVKDGYVPILLSMSATESAQKISTQHTLNLDKGTKIGGKVQDTQNNFIEGVTVSISLQSSNRNETAIISGHMEKTDANGLWFCDIIPENPDRIMIRFTDPNYRTESLPVQSPSPIMQMLREMSHVMVMQKQLNLTGQVLDTEGKPIAGALVAQGADRRAMYYPDTKTGNEGRYMFENVTPGEVVLTVQADGFSPDTMRFSVDRQMSPIIFRLEPGRTIKGQVVEPNNAPVANATVSADMWREFRSLTWETTTDANGRFVWNSAPSDELSINVNKRRYIIIRNYSVKPSEKEYVITLNPELYIHGTVVDANSSEPVNDFRFYAGVEGGAGQDIAWKSSYRVTKRNNYEMRFTYPSNEYYIRMEAEGYEPEMSRAISGSEGNVILDFKLNKIMPVTGTVLSPDGKPLSGAEVIVVTSQLRIQNSKAGSRPSSDKLSVKTGEDGTFSFAPKTDNFSIAILNEQGYAFVNKNELETKQNITLSGWARLEGTLKIGDKPGVKETITYIPQSIPDVNNIIFDFQTQTDEKGNFVFDRIPPGEGSVTRVIRTSGDLQLNTHTVSVKAVPGQTVNMNIGGTGRPVTGKIIIPEQIKNRTTWQNIEGTLNINSVNNPYLQISFNVDKDGSFRIDDVPSGEYSLYVQAYDLNSQIRLSNKEQVGLLTHPFTVPEPASGRNNEMLDLGQMELEITTDVASGQSLLRKAIPDFENIKIDFPETEAQGKSILVCFWDFEQRPSRNCIIELNKKAIMLKEKNVVLAAVHISKIEKDTLDNWLKENEITIPKGTAEENESKIRYNWGIKSLPWLVITNTDHIVTDEGFGINELDEKIK